MNLDELQQVRRQRRAQVAASIPVPAPSAVASALAQGLAPNAGALLLPHDAAIKSVTALRLAGYTVAEIATETALTINQVRRLLVESKAKRQVFEDLIDGRAMPAAVDNLIAGLEAGDKDYTLETLKGRGVLVKHTHQEGQAAKSAFQFNIVVEAPQDGQREPLLGAVVGEPRQLDEG